MSSLCRGPKVRSAAGRERTGKRQRRRVGGGRCVAARDRETHHLYRTRCVYGRTRSSSLPPVAGDPSTTDAGGRAARRRLASKVVAAVLHTDPAARARSLLRCPGSDSHPVRCGCRSVATQPHTLCRNFTWAISSSTRPFNDDACPPSVRISSRLNMM